MNPPCRKSRVIKLTSNAEFVAAMEEVLAVYARARIRLPADLPG